MTILSTRTSLLVARLLQRKSDIRWTYELALLLLCGGLMSAALFFLPQQFAAVFGLYPAAVLIGSAIFTLITPLICGCGAALIVGRGWRSEAYDLLRVTPISAKVLVWCSALATLYRLRNFLRLMLCLTPLLALWIGFNGLQGNIFRNSPRDRSAACAVSPLGFHYCTPIFVETRSGIEMYSANNSATIDALVWQAQLALAGFGAAVSLLGVCLLAALIGAVLASVINHPYAAVGLAFALCLILGYGLIAVIYPELVICAEIDLRALHILFMLTYTVLLGLLPFGLAIFGMRSVENIARVQHAN